MLMMFKVVQSSVFRVQSSVFDVQSSIFSPDCTPLGIKGIKPGQPPTLRQLPITNYQLQMPFPVQGPNACEKNEERLPHAAFSSQVHLLIHQRSTAFNGGQRRLTAQKKIKRQAKQSQPIRGNAAPPSLAHLDSVLPSAETT